jgi:UDP-N-acetylmuramoyl-tripeptide--D-alanyl-D-alanine ligase
MTLWNYSELKQALKNQLINDFVDLNIAIDQVVIDSRKVVKNSLFIALKGENTDGHNYLNQAIESGASYVLANKIPQEFDTKYHSKLILVNNTYEALDSLAKFARQRFSGKVIGLTGSVGKTTTKEMLGIAFASQGKTHINQGNFNNHIGLPMSLANLPSTAQFAIFEMGMNHFNEISHLTKICQPDIAIITNVGPVHIEFFANESEIALAKSEIFHGLTKNGSVILNIDNPHYDLLYNQAISNHINPDKIFSFGTKKSANYHLKNYHFHQQKILTTLEVEINNQQTYSYNLNTINYGHIANSLVAIACLDLAKADIKSGLLALENYQNSNGRGKINEIIFENKKISIIDDSYNASILSMKAGIENCFNLKKIFNYSRVILAIGDMLELGDKSPEIHQELLEFINKFSFDSLILVGKQLSLVNDKLKISKATNFADSLSAQQYFLSHLNDNDLVYIKGSRGIKMERLIENIIPKNHA